MCFEGFIILFSTIITTMSDIVLSINDIVITIITSIFAIAIITALGFRVRQFRAAFLSNLAHALFLIKAIGLPTGIAGCCGVLLRL